MARHACDIESRDAMKKQTRLQTSASDTATSKRTRHIIHKEDQSKTGFPNLPSELRNSIYEHALRPADGEAFPFRLYKVVKLLGTVAFNLLNACYAIRKEANGIFYSQNTFRIDLLDVPQDSFDLRIALSECMHQGLSEVEARREVGSLRYELRRPRLHQVLDAISAENLALIKSLEFAYHITKPLPLNYLDSIDLSRTPEITIELTILEPGSDLVIHHRFGDEGYRKHWERKVAPEMSQHFAGFMANRAKRVFVKDDILAVAGFIVNATHKYEAVG